MKEQTWHSADEMKTTLLDNKGEVLYPDSSVCRKRFTVLSSFDGAYVQMLRIYQLVTNTFDTAYNV